MKDTVRTHSTCLEKRAVLPGCWGDPHHDADKNTTPRLYPRTSPRSFAMKLVPLTTTYAEALEGGTPLISVPSTGSPVAATLTTATTTTTNCGRPLTSPAVSPYFFGLAPVAVSLTSTMYSSLPQPADLTAAVQCPRTPTTQTHSCCRLAHPSRRAWRVLQHPPTVAGGPLDEGATTAGHRGGASSTQPRRRVGQRLDCCPAPTTRDGCSCAKTATTAAAATTAAPTTAAAADAAVPALQRASRSSSARRCGKCTFPYICDVLALNECRPGSARWCTCRCSCGASPSQNAGRGGGGSAHGNPPPPGTRGKNIAQGNSGTSGLGQRPQPKRPRPG